MLKGYFCVHSRTSNVHFWTHMYINYECKILIFNYLNKMVHKLALRGKLLSGKHAKELSDHSTAPTEAQ
jgi:hypothetical protein